MSDIKDLVLILSPCNISLCIHCSLCNHSELSFLFVGNFVKSSNHKESVLNFFCKFWVCVLKRPYLCLCCVFRSRIFELLLYFISVIPYNLANPFQQGLFIKWPKKHLDVMVLKAVLSKHGSISQWLSDYLFLKCLWVFFINIRGNDY